LLKSALLADLVGFAEGVNGAARAAEG